MNRIAVVLFFLLIFTNCKEKTKEIKILTEFQNSQVSFDFFCNREESTSLMYYENDMELEEYLPVFKCKANEEIYQFLVQNVTLDNGVWLTLSELSCINDNCVVKEKPRERLLGAPNGELRFRVINKDVIKLVYSNIRQLGYQDGDDAIHYSKAKDFLDVKRNIYIFKRRPELNNCPISKIVVDTVGKKGVSCSEEIPEVNESPAGEEPTNQQ